MLLGLAVFFYVNAGTDIKTLNLNVTVSCPSCTPTPTPTPTETPTPTATPQPGGGGGGGAVSTPIMPKAAAVEFKGLAYPGVIVSILRDSQLIGAVTAGSDGSFALTDSGLAGGNYNFGFIATDNEGRKSIILSFILNVVAESTTSVAGIIIPPTISIDREQLSPGDKLGVSGQATPGSAITIEILPEELISQTTARNDGSYSIKITTRNLEVGMHTVRSKAKLKTGGESIFSEVAIFGLGVPYTKRGFEIPGVGLVKIPDFNGDARVNIVDVSVMIYWFKKSVPGGFFADLNNNGVVDIADFSILVFYWTG